MGRALVVRVAAVVGLSIAASAACRDPTQITVEVTTDVKCSDLRGTTFTVGELAGLDQRPLTTRTGTCDPERSRVGSIVIVPSGSNDATVAIRVVAGLGVDPSQCEPSKPMPGCIVARRALRFVPHTSLTLPIFMGASCDGIGCGETETCVAGGCRSAIIPESEACADPAGCGESVLVAGDGGVDAGADASVDASVDAGLCGSGADLMTDRKNCGSCGHDCQGTACVNGRCEAVEIVGGQDLPLHLALDATTVYWTNATGGTIGSCPKTGCTASTQLASGQGSSDRIVVASAGLFWTNYGATIGYCPLPGCPGGARTIATGQTSTVGIAADATNAYFTTDDGAVKACARAGCGATPTVLASAQATPTGMGRSGAWLVWTNLGAGGGAASGAIVGCALPGCTTKVTYATGMASPGFVTADAERVYWTTQGLNPDREGAVWSCPIAGCAGTPVPIATKQTHASVIAVDGPNLYWSNGGHFGSGTADGEIVRCSAASCASTLTVLASGMLRPWGIAVDATHVYWTTASANGKVLRVAK